jgi:hypothetical protein
MQGGDDRPPRVPRVRIVPRAFAPRKILQEGRLQDDISSFPRRRAESVLFISKFLVFRHQNNAGLR